MPTGLGTVTLKFQLTPSEEREAIAKFVEYAFTHSWTVQDATEAIRSGNYLVALIQKDYPSGGK